MSSFRLFDLPLVPLKSVLKSINVIDLLDLSLCSLETSKILECSMRKVLKVDIVLDNFSKIKSKSINLRTEHGVICAAWNFGAEACRGRKIESRTIEGHTFRFQKLCAPIAYSNCSHPDITMSVVLSRFKQIFDCQIINIHVWTNNLGSFSKYLVEVKSCENFTCRGADRVSNEDLKFVLEELKVSGKFVLSVNGNFAQSSDNVILNAKSVTLLNRVHWMSSNTLLSSDCEEMFLERCAFLLETYELFVTRWMSGSFYQNLKYIRIGDKKEIELEVLKARGTAWDPKQRGRYFILSDMFAVDCAEGIDILRSDGTMATVITKFQNFLMFVWHERFPVLAEQRIKPLYYIW